MRCRYPRAFLAVALLLWAFALPVNAAERFITVASTTSTENSGLFKHLLPQFQQATGIEVRVVAVGTGQAIKNAERGDADVLFVHHRPSEEAFVAQGFGVARREVMYNDYVLVGPQTDPAGIKGTQDAVAALSLHGAPHIVVDFGTATKFNCVNVRGEFIGGAIAPGIATSVDAMFSRAARLYRVEMVRPKEAVGRNTATNIQAGVVYGYAAMVDGMVERMRAEMGGEPVVVATGGLAPLIAEVARSIQHVNENLTLEGVRLLWEQAGGR